MKNSIYKEDVGQCDYWGQLEGPWQCCIEEAWLAYCKGSLPIGAVVTDASGNILARGRNRVYEDETEGILLHGHRLAHAEMNALISVHWRQVNPRNAILYTTTEPCPLCVGAVRLTRLGTVHYASRDSGAGSADLFTANPFMERGKIQVIGPHDVDLETILIALLLEMTLRLEDNNMSLVYDKVAAIHPVGAQLGRELFNSEQLCRWGKDGSPASVVINHLAQRLYSLRVA